MPRKLIISLFALLIALPALAQLQMPVMQPPVVAQPVIVSPQAIEPVAVSPSDSASFDPALTPETARAAIAKLRARNRELRGQMAVTLGDLQAARATLDEMTRAGGSLVRAQCVSASLSRNTAGAEENCAASGYNCSPAEGTCRRLCTSSDQCTGGFVCDIGAARCIVPPTGDD